MDLDTIFYNTAMAEAQHAQHMLSLTKHTCDEQQKLITEAVQHLSEAIELAKTANTLRLDPPSIVTVNGQLYRKQVLLASMI
jgi:rubrerythrin